MSGVGGKVQEREQWGHKLEFLMSCLGYAVGIGNVWRFPYMCYRNGGGAFLVPYLLTLIICGIPLFYMETTLGQFTSSGCISIFKINPLFKGAGYATVVLNVIGMLYFSLIMTYPMLYMFHTLSAQLPWETCNNEWNTESCTEVLTSLSQTNGTSDAVSTPADEFFQYVYQLLPNAYSSYRLLKISSDINHLGGIVWPILWCNLLCWSLVYLCISNGVRSVGKIVYFTVSFPYVILVILFIRGVTLPGAWEGIKFYLSPDWAALQNPKVWADAAIQVFYSLGPGWGGIVCMASFNPFRHKILRDSMIVPLANSGTSIFAGFVVFSVLGFLAQRTGADVARVAAGGPGLAYITYPTALAMMPWPRFWSFMFFFMLFLLGIDSMFVSIEAVIAAVVDEFPQLKKRKRLITLLTCVLLFVGSLVCCTEGGMYVVQLLDWYLALLSVPLVCLLEVGAVAWTYGAARFASDLRFMTRAPVSRLWLYMWKYINPVMLLIIMWTAMWSTGDVTYAGRNYPAWAVRLGWCVTVVSALCIPIYAARMLYRAKGSFVERVKSCCQPTPEWGPADADEREAWEQMVLSKPSHIDLTEIVK